MAYSDLAKKVGARCAGELPPQAYSPGEQVFNDCIPNALRASENKHKKTVGYKDQLCDSILLCVCSSSTQHRAIINLYCSMRGNPARLKINPTKLFDLEAKKKIS